MRFLLCPFACAWLVAQPVSYNIPRGRLQTIDIHTLQPQQKPFSMVEGLTLLLVMVMVMVMVMAFDSAHFSTIRLHAPEVQRATYAKTPWKRFRNYVYY